VEALLVDLLVDAPVDERLWHTKRGWYTGLPERADDDVAHDLPAADREPVAAAVRRVLARRFRRIDRAAVFGARRGDCCCHVFLLGWSWRWCADRDHAFHAGESGVDRVPVAVAAGRVSDRARPAFAVVSDRLRVP